jgi:hypothetical protein
MERVDFARVVIANLASRDVDHTLQFQKHLSVLHVVASSLPFPLSPDQPELVFAAVFGDRPVHPQPRTNHS